MKSNIIQTYKVKGHGRDAMRWRANQLQIKATTDYCYMFQQIS